MAGWRKPVRLVLVSMIGLGLITIAQVAVGADNDDSKSRGSCKGASCPKPGPGPEVDPDPPPRGDLPPGVNLVDPRVKDMLIAEAREELGDRFVDLWVADDESGLVLGVYAPTKADQEYLRLLSSSPLVSVFECPVSLAELRAAANLVFDIGDGDFIEVGIDVITGQIELGVTWEEVVRIVTQINAHSNGILAVAAGDEIPASNPGKVVVVVDATEMQMVDEMLIPTETLTRGPLRAGKEIRIPTYLGKTYLCTSNALVKSGSARFMLTAGHCGGVGDSVFYPRSFDWVGRFTISTWHPYVLLKLTDGDVGMFPAPADAEASIYVNPNKASSITGIATDISRGDKVCMRGRSTDAEECGKVTSVVNPFTRSEGRIVMGYIKTDLEHLHGDSGAPVYMKTGNDEDAVLVGIHSGGRYDLDGNSLPGTSFTPISQALRVTGTEVATSGSILQVVPHFETDLMSRPFEQIVLSPDFTGDGRGEIVAVDRLGRLVFHEAKANGAPKYPAYMDGRGFRDHTVYAPGNWDKRGRADIVTVTEKDGKMWLFPRGDNGVLGPRKQIGQGWGGYTIIPVGDVNGDGNPDLLAIRNSTGDLYLYAGDGRGGFKFPYPKVGYGWKGYELFAAGDLDNDGKADILSIDKAGDLWFYKGKGDGTFHKKVQVGNSWHGYKLAAGADLDGDGLADIVGRDSAGRLYFTRQRVPGASRRRCWSEQDGEDSVEQ